MPSSLVIPVIVVTIVTFLDLVTESGRFQDTQAGSKTLRQVQASSKKVKQAQAGSGRFQEIQAGGSDRLQDIQAATNSYMCVGSRYTVGRE